MAGIRDSSSDRSSGQHESDIKTPFAAFEDPVLLTNKTQGAFDNGSMEDYYRPKDSYEGAHRYDPQFQWETKEEKKLVRKVCFVIRLCFARASLIHHLLSD